MEIRSSLGQDYLKWSAEPPSLEDARGVVMGLGWPGRWKTIDNGHGWRDWPSTGTVHLQGPDALRLVMIEAFRSRKVRQVGMFG